MAPLYICCLRSLQLGATKSRGLGIAFTTRLSMSNKGGCAMQWQMPMPQHAASSHPLAVACSVSWLSLAITWPSRAHVLPCPGGTHFVLAQYCFYVHRLSTAVFPDVRLQAR